MADDFATKPRTRRLNSLNYRQYLAAKVKFFEHHATAKALMYLVFLTRAVRCIMHIGKITRKPSITRILKKLFLKQNFMKFYFWNLIFYFMEFYF